MDRGTLRAIVHGIAKSRTELKQPNTQVHIPADTLNNLTSCGRLSLNEWVKLACAQKLALENCVFLDEGIFHAFSCLVKASHLKAAESNDDTVKVAITLRKMKGFFILVKYLLKSYSIFADPSRRENSTSALKPQSSNHNIKLLKNALLFGTDC